MKHVAESAFVLLGLMSTIQARFRSNIKQTPIPLPSDNPIPKKFSSWLSAFNTVDEATINDFYSTICNESFPEDVENCKPAFMAASDQIFHLANRTGGFELVDLESNSNDNAITVLLRPKSDVYPTGYFKTRMTIDQDKPEQPITSLEIFPVTTPLKLIAKDHPNWNDYEKALQPLTPTRKERLIEDIINVLRQHYVFPDQAEETIAIISNNLKNGAYDSFTDNDDFGMRIVKDLHNSTSRSFNVPYLGFMEPSWLLEGSREAEEKQMEKTILERDKYIEEIGYGYGNITLDTETIPSKTIATFPITQLFDLDIPGLLFATMVKMNSIADADMLILDLRNCFGVDDKTVAYILSYLFDEPKALTNSIDRNGIVHNTTSTLPISGLYPVIKTYGGQKPIYVLTNKNTMAGAEFLAYSLQAYQRALIVGEDASTAGWAHPRQTTFELCEDVFGKGWWRMGVQTLRTVHLATGRNWEKFGVSSDIEFEKTEDARMAAIGFEKWRVAKEQGMEGQDELK